jgi:DNA-binding CsgD family transcriptional regulator
VSVREEWESDRVGWKKRSGFRDRSRNPCNSIRLRATIVEPKLPLSVENFAQAAQLWDLERLYVDLAAAKREFAPHKKRGLTEVEKERLRGLLCGESPAEIATILHISPGGLLVSLGELYRYVEVLTQREPHTLKNWRDVVDWLEVAGYRQASSSALPPGSSWQDVPDISTFYGRTAELEVLKKWVTIDVDWWRWWGWQVREKRRWWSSCCGN